MAQILIRDLDAKLVQRLKEQAQENGRSLQAEAKEILKRGARMNRKEIQKALCRIRKATKGRVFSDSVELLREDRYE